MQRSKIILGIRTILFYFGLSLILCVSIRCFASTIVYPKEKTQEFSGFSDVPAESYYYGYVSNAVELGFMDGYSDGTFGLRDLLTRGQFAQVLYNSYSQDFIGTNTQFIDVQRDQWYAPAVAWVNHYNIMNGCSKNEFGPDGDLSWEQVIKTLYNLAGEPESEYSLSYLDNYDEISEYARVAYRWGLEYRIAEEKNDHVFPKDLITRGELAKVMVAYNNYIAGAGYKKPVYEKPDLSRMSMEQLFFKKTMYHPHNNEMQVYIPDQSNFTENGAIITAIDCGNKKYKSGNVQTNISFRYGVFEFEFNNLTGKGYWPAIWMLPDSKKTRFPELDIYEMVGDSPHKLHGSLHHFDPEESVLSGKFQYDTNAIKFIYDQDQVPPKTTIRLEWTKDALIWTFNDRVVRKITHDVPDNYMYLIMNLAIGGNWPGEPAPDTPFPAEFRPTITRFEPVEYKYRGS